MRHHASMFLFVLSVATVQCPAASSEAAFGECAIWGQVVIPGRPVEEPANVELAVGNHKATQKARLIGGNFDFHAVPPGWYQFRILDASGRELYRRPIALTGTDDYLIVQTPQQRPGSTISVAELKRETNPKARDEVNAARKALDDGKPQVSAEHLLKALDIDSQYLEARVDLTAVYTQMDDVQDALEQAQKAFELSPSSPVGGYQYAVLLMVTKNYTTAETVARSLIRNQDYLAQAKAVLAVSLIGQRRNLAEALSLIEEVASEFPLSRLMAANALVEARRPVEAVNQVRGYLNSSNKCERAKLEEWLAKASEHSPSY
jgi:tetratricopeptide (TPR) repeat protein